MKSTLKSLALISIAAAGFAAVTGCDRNDHAQVQTPPETSRTPGQAVDDKALASKVRSALDADTVKYTDVKVESYKGIVQLSGFADTSEQKNRADDIAGKVAGVKKVENNITLKTKTP